jgi:hypothetical protein
MAMRIIDHHPLLAGGAFASGVGSVVDAASSRQAPPAAEWFRPLSPCPPQAGCWYSRLERHPFASGRVYFSVWLTAGRSRVKIFSYQNTRMCYHANRSLDAAG